MLLQICVRDEGSGLLPEDSRDGDILFGRPDSYAGSFGTQDKKSYLIVSIADPPDVEQLLEVMNEPVMEPDPNNPEGPAITVYKRRYFVSSWRSKFTSAEIAVILDSTAMLPDGALVGDGTVSSGIVSGKFTHNDIVEKT